MTLDEIYNLDWSKGDGLLPAIIQHAITGRVLMLGYMNQDALRETLAGGRVVFFSRSRQQLWTKGETSGNRLAVRSLLTDCDSDTVLVRVHREGDGKVCHTGTVTCFTTPMTVGAQASAPRTEN